MASNRSVKKAVSDTSIHIVLQSCVFFLIMAVGGGLSPVMVLQPLVVMVFFALNYFSDKYPPTPRLGEYSQTARDLTVGLNDRRAGIAAPIVDRIDRFYADGYSRHEHPEATAELEKRIRLLTVIADEQRKENKEALLAGDDDVVQAQLQGIVIPPEPEKPKALPAPYPKPNDYPTKTDYINEIKYHKMAVGQMDAAVQADSRNRSTCADCDIPLFDHESHRCVFCRDKPFYKSKYRY